jgi:hypothetical protein
MFWLKKMENRMTTAQMASSQPSAMSTITLSSHAFAYAAHCTQMRAR